MDSSIAISVLITTYNLVDYVDETIESVVNQKFDQPMEIIIGDDGSSDGTIEKLEQWKNRYPDLITYYVMDRDLNVTYNRIERASLNRINILKHARGKYFIFLDGDDFYVDDYKLQKQYRLLELCENKDYVMCGHSVWEYYSDDKKSVLGRFKSMEKLSPGEYWKRGRYCHSDSLLIRNVLDIDDLPEIAIKNFDDNIIAFCMLKYGGIICTNDIMVCYRQVANSSWNTVGDIEKNIINLMDYSIERRINPLLSKASLKRHLLNFVVIRARRKSISEDMAKKYINIAKERKDPVTYNVLNLPQKGFAGRLKFDFWLLGQIIVNLPLIVWKVLKLR